MLVSAPLLCVPSATTTTKAKHPVSSGASHPSSRRHRRIYAIDPRTYLSGTNHTGGPTDGTLVTEGFRVFIEYGAMALEAAAAVIILGAGARALVRYVRNALSRTKDGEVRGLTPMGRTIHQEFGRSLLLALDFTIGSDVLKVSITSALQDVTVAAVVVGVRVVLTFVLRYELSKARDEAS